MPVGMEITKEFIMSIYFKAIWSAFTAGAIAFLSSLLTAFQGENVGFDTITDGQWITALLAFFVAAAGTGGVTYRVKNRPD
jgi:energy-converting hydrogenase Eha subunit G